jgi:lysophospholipase L1-like esterase
VDISTCRRALSVLGAVVVAATLVACDTPAPGGGPVAVQPPTCPFDDVVQVDGDSLAAGMTPHLRAGVGHTLFGSAVGGSGLTGATPREQVDDRVNRWLDACGAPDLVVIEAGLNDIIQGAGVEQLTAEVLALDSAIAGAGSEALWVTVPPLAAAGGYASRNPERRAYNDWLRTADELDGRVVDVVPALEDPGAPDTLAPWYLWFSTDLFKPDGLHPNAEGYRAMAAAVQPALDAALAD